ncbi:MAG: hypothetical protein V1709_04035 [Planctomycetota bacterium]
MSEEKLLSHIKVYVPAFNVFPLEKAKEWAENYYRSVWHIRGQGRKSVSSQKDYREKIAKPLIDEYQKMMSNNPNWRSKHGRSAEEIMEKMKHKMLSRHSARKYLQGIDKAFGTKDGVRAKEIKDRLNLYACDYAQKMTFATWRYLGPINGQGKGAFVIAGYWLTGNPQTPEFIREKDEIVTGESILITDPSRKGLFQRQLRAKMMRSIVLLDAYNYSPEIVKRENDKINQMVNEFLTGEIVRFESGGLSHIDFVTIPKTAELFYSERLHKVRDDIRAYFLGKKPEKAQPLLANQPNVSDLIGDNKLPICMDMYIDIQVIGR